MEERKKLYISLLIITGFCTIIFGIIIYYTMSMSNNLVNILNTRNEDIKKLEKQLKESSNELEHYKTMYENIVAEQEIQEEKE